MMVLQDLKSLIKIVPENLLDLLKLILFVKLIHGFQQFFLPILVNEQRHSLYSVHIIVFIESFSALYERITFITAVDSFLHAARRVGAHFPRITACIGAGIVGSSAASAPCLQKTMVTRQTTSRDRIYSLSCLLTQLVTDPAHCFYMHDPVS